jgi:hypothetical protein
MLINFRVSLNVGDFLSGSSSSQEEVTSMDYAYFI